MTYNDNWDKKDVIVNGKDKKTILVYITSETMSNFDKSNSNS